MLPRLSSAIRITERVVLRSRRSSNRDTGLLRAGVSLALLLLVGCQPRGAGPAASADEVHEPAAAEPAAAADAEDSKATDEGAESQQSAQDSESEKKPAAEASKDDLTQVLQAVIDDQELDPYWQLGEPGRLPVLIAGDIPSDLALVKSTKPVKIVDIAEKKDKPVLVFTEIKIAGNEANVRYRYDVEGVRGSAVVSRRHGRWELTRSRVTKR